MENDEKFHWEFKQDRTCQKEIFSCSPNQKAKGLFIYYVITFLEFFGPPLRQHVFSTKNKQKLAFSDPLLLPTSADVIYEWHR